MVRNDFFDPTRDEKLRTSCASGSRLRSLLPLRAQEANYQRGALSGVS